MSRDVSTIKESLALSHKLLVVLEVDSEESCDQAQCLVLVDAKLFCLLKLIAIHVLLNRLSVSVFFNQQDYLLFKHVFGGLDQCQHLL